MAKHVKGLSAFGQNQTHLHFWSYLLITQAKLTGAFFQLPRPLLLPWRFAISWKLINPGPAISIFSIISCEARGIIQSMWLFLRGFILGGWPIPWQYLLAKITVAGILVRSKLNFQPRKYLQEGFCVKSAKLTCAFDNFIGLSRQWSPDNRIIDGEF